MQIPVRRATPSIATWNRSQAEEDAMGAAHAPIWRRMMDVSVADDMANTSVLDFGCNQGGFLRFLYDHHPFKSGLGIDIARESVGRAELLKGRRPIEYKVSESAAAMGRVFDLAFSHEVLYLLPDLVQHARDIKAALRPGGIYVAAIGCHKDSTLWPRWRMFVLPLCVLFFIVDVGFVIANGAKFFDGAWFPVVLGLAVFTLLRTWRRGRELLHEEVRKEGIQIGSFLPGLMLAPPTRVPGTAVFMTADQGVVPHALLHNLKHNKVLHERNVFLTVETLTVPHAPQNKRLKIDPIGDDFYRVLIRFGFMETPDVPLALMRSCDAGGIYFDPMDTTYFASRETIVAGRHRGMPVWRDKLFAFMHRNAAPATGFFRIPGNRLVELGAQVEI